MPIHHMITKLHLCFGFPTIVLLIAAWASAGAPCRAQIVNGSFEDPDVSSTGISYPEPKVIYQTYWTSLPGWVVSQGSVDIVHHLQPTAYDGNQSMDLNGEAMGGIYQDVVTVPGQWYQLSFEFSGNPIGATLRSMRVNWDGRIVISRLDYDPLAHGNSYQFDMGWLYESIYVQANSVLSRLEFLSLNGGSSGPTIDEVRLVAVPEPSLWTLTASMGLLGLAALRRLC